MQVFVEFNLAEAFHLARYTERNRKVLTETAALRFYKYIRGRYLSLSGGRGEWPPLADSTIKKKEQRALSNNPSAILRETDTLLGSLDVVFKSGTWLVGYVHDGPHNDSRKSIEEIAVYHNQGTDTMPQRPVLALPSSRVQRQMVEDVRNQYNKEIRRVRRKR